MSKHLRLLSLSFLLINTSEGSASAAKEDPIGRIESPSASIHPYDPVIEDSSHLGLASRVEPAAVPIPAAPTSFSWGFSGMMEALTSLMPSARQNTALQTTIADQHETIRVLREQLAEAKEAQTRAQLLKTKAQEDRSSILLTVQKSETAAALQKLREEELTRVIAQKDQIISELEKANAALKLEKSEHDELETILTRELQELAGDEKDSQKIRELRPLVEKARAKVLTLEDKAKNLEAQKKVAEEQAKQLQQAIQINDHYEQIKGRMLDKNVSDGDLALFMLSIMTFLGEDLDQLSQGKPESLVRILCNISRPEQDHPSYCSECNAGKSPSSYKNCFRKLGNLFVPNGFAYHGNPIVWDRINYENSDFKQRASTYAAEAKKKLIH